MRSWLRNFAALALAAASLGCATHKFVVADFEKSAAPRFPAISVFGLKATDEFRAECEAFDAKSALHHCRMDQLKGDALRAALEATGQFARVALGDEREPYALAVGLAAYDEETATELGTAAVAGGSLFLVPMRNEIELAVRARLFAYGEPVRSFDYRIPFTLVGSWATLDSDGTREIATSIASYLVRDLQKGDSFSDDALRAQLKAEDYRRDFIVPERVGRFRRSELEVARNPLEGAHWRFEHDEGLGHVLVSARPIRHWRFEQEERLAIEADAFRKDLALLGKDGTLAGLELQPIETLRWTVGGKEVRALHFDGAQRSPSGEETATRTTLVVRGDKIVVFAARFEKGAAALDEFPAFAEALAGQLALPEESLFMARLRKQWRDGGQE